MKQFLAARPAGLVLFIATLTATAAVPASAHAGVSSAPAASARDMTGAYFLRDSLIPRADDLALIQRKPALYLASFNDGMATVAYSLEGGRIVYRVVSGTVEPVVREAIDRALAKFQRKAA